MNILETTTWTKVHNIFTQQKNLYSSRKDGAQRRDVIAWHTEPR